MVTFFCNNCGQYLKKKQAEEHGFHCSSSLSCNDCRKDFEGMPAIRGHTDCHPPNPDPKKSTRLAVKLEEKFSGFRNSARKIVKKSKTRKMELALLKESLRKYMAEQGEDMADFDRVFLEKVKSAKNLVIEGNFVKYERK